MTSVNSAADLTVDDVARRIGVSIFTVKAYVRSGVFEHERLGPQPQPGARDYRRIRFTQRQADKIAQQWRETVAADAAAETA